MVACHFVTSRVIIPVVEMAKNEPKQVDEAPFIRLHTCAHVVCLFGNHLHNDILDILTRIMCLNVIL